MHILPGLDNAFERLVTRIGMMLGRLTLADIHARIVDAGDASEEAFFLAYKAAELLAGDAESVHSDL